MKNSINVDKLVKLEITLEEVALLWNACIFANDKTTDMKTAANLQMMQDKLAGAIYEAQL